MPPSVTAAFPPPYLLAGDRAAPDGPAPLERRSADLTRRAIFVLLQGGLPMTATLKQPGAWIPLAMSFVALAVVLGHVAMYGTARQADEGAAAHLWQLLMAVQIPVVLFFVVSRFGKNLQQTVLVLALQAVAYLAALAPVYLLKF
jgi:hypothetical protein